MGSILRWADESIIDDIGLWVLIAIIVFTSIQGTIHALLNKRDPRSALLWLIINLGIPVFGPLSYWLLGINRIRRKAHRLYRHHTPYFRTTGAEAFTVHSLPDRFRGFRNLEHLADRVTRNSTLSGNTVLPLFNGEQAYPEMLAAIEHATDSIHISSYIFDGDGVGETFAEALRSAASRGVHVRIIVDALGELYSKHPIRTVLKGQNVAIHPYLPLYKSPFINLRNHRKLLIVDSSLAFTGGMNIRTNHCLEKVSPDHATRDINFKIRGPSVKDLQLSFLDDWHFVTGDVIDLPCIDSDSAPVREGEALVRVVSDGPDREHRMLELLITGALTAAQKNIWIMTPYFIPDRAMVSALITTALRGVDVTLVVPKISNLPFVSWASRATYWELLQNGVTIFEQPPPFNHTKLMTVDGVWSLIGSANLDTRSLRLNFELNLSVYDAYLTESLNQYVEEILNFSHRVSLQEMDHRPLPIRVRDGIARLFSPYL